MSAFEGSYKSLLQGVSQQVPRERLEGQVSAQDNMLSDAVTNLRRRPGAEFKYIMDVAGAGPDDIRGWDTDIGGQHIQIILNTKTGVLRIMDENYNVVQTLAANPYLIAAKRSDIQAATVDSQFAFINRGIKPTLGAPDPAIQNPAKSGFFYIKAGAFSTPYQITVTTAAGSTLSATYTTPNGTAAGDAALATPEYIAQQLANSLLALGSGMSFAINANTVFVYAQSFPAVSGLTVSTSSGSARVGVSGQSFLALESELPAKLHPLGDNYVIATGSLRAPTYYKYVAAKSAWLEAGQYGSPGSLQNMPVLLQFNSGTGQWAFDTSAYEGRLAGDDETNAAPNFITRGITGIASWQGRMVLLAGNLVCMSASRKVHRWYRSSVVSLLDDDRIEVGNSANSSAAYEYAIPFQSDLLLFSEKYQALVPGTAQAITPRTASVVVTSTYQADMTSSPTPAGRTLMYPAPRSEDFFGVMEMLPSTYVAQQYTSADVTAHLPKYLPGRCRFSVSSSVSGIVMFSPEGDNHSLIVHEYQWDGDKKVQQAWHRWTFPYPIADAYFSGAQVNLMFVNNGKLVGANLDPRIGTLTSLAQRRPYLDLYAYANVADNVVGIPTWMQSFDPSIATKLKLSNLMGQMAGEEVGIDSTTSTALTTVPSYADGPVAVGVPYRSSFSPTPPNVKDYNGVIISSNKLTLLRFMIGTANSSEYEVIVQDAALEASGGAEALELPTLYWTSSELDLGRARVNNESVSILPCRTRADTTTVLVYTEGTGELNLISLEYTCRYNQKLRRR